MDRQIVTKCLLFYGCKWSDLEKPRANIFHQYLVSKHHFADLYSDICTTARTGSFTSTERHARLPLHAAFAWCPTVCFALTNYHLWQILWNIWSCSVNRGWCCICGVLLPSPLQWWYWNWIFDQCVSPHMSTLESKILLKIHVNIQRYNYVQACFEKYACYTLKQNCFTW